MRAAMNQSSTTQVPSASTRGSSRQYLTWGALGLCLVLGAFLLGRASVDRGIETKTASGRVLSIEEDGALLCLKLQDDGEECFTATDTVSRVRVGDHVTITYGSVPIEPGAPASTDRLMSIRVETTS